METEGGEGIDAVDPVNPPGPDGADDAERVGVEWALAPPEAVRVVEGDAAEDACGWLPPDPAGVATRAVVATLATAAGEILPDRGTEATAGPARDPPRPGSPDPYRLCGAELPSSGSSRCPGSLAPRVRSPSS